MLDQRLAPGQDPPVHDVLRLGGVGVVDKLLAVRSLVQLGLADEESQTIDPSSDDRVSNVSNAVILEDQVVTSDDGRVDQVQPEGVTSVLMQDLLWVGVIPQALAHLLSIATQDQSRDDQVLPRRRVEQMCSEDDQSVEPSSGLVDTLGNEIGREGSLELFVRGAEGVVLLSVGHATGSR